MMWAMPNSVDIRQHGAISVVTLNRPDVRNAVDAATARALHAAFLAFDADENARVAVFHGAHGPLLCRMGPSPGAGGGAGASASRLSATNHAGRSHECLHPMGLAPAAGPAPGVGARQTVH